MNYDANFNPLSLILAEKLDIHITKESDFTILPDTVHDVVALAWIENGKVQLRLIDLVEFGEYAEMAVKASLREGIFTPADVARANDVAEQIIRDPEVTEALSPEGVHEYMEKHHITWATEDHFEEIYKYLQGNQGR